MLKTSTIIILSVFFFVLAVAVALAVTQTSQHKKGIESRPAKVVSYQEAEDFVTSRG